MLIFSSLRNYSHTGWISLDKSANKQKGVARATKSCATLMDGLSPLWGSRVLTCVHCSCPSHRIQPKPHSTKYIRVTSQQICPFPRASQSNSKGRESSCRHAQVSRRNRNAPKFTAWSHSPRHRSFAIRSISLGVDGRRVKDSLTLLSLAVRTPGWSLQLLWVVLTGKDERRQIQFYVSEIPWTFSPDKKPKKSDQVLQRNRAMQPVTLSKCNIRIVFFPMLSFLCQKGFDGYNWLFLLVPSE